MNRSWISGAKALVASTALACVAMVASTVAQADYSYTFTLTPTTIGTQFGLASGSFNTNGMIGSGQVIETSGNYSYTYGGQSYSGNFNPQFSLFSTSGFFALGNGGGFSIRGSNYIIAPDGSVSSTSATINSNQFVASSSGFFDAILTSSGGGGGGGGSGGAPTPEVNAGLGVLLAGASFVFLRRKRGGRLEAVEA